MQHRRMRPGGETQRRKPPGCSSHSGLPPFLHSTFHHQSFYIFLAVQVFEWKFLNFVFSGGNTDANPSDQNSSCWHAAQRPALTCPFPIPFPPPLPPPPVSHSILKGRPRPGRLGYPRSPNTSRSRHRGGLDLSGEEEIQRRETGRVPSPWPALPNGNRTRQRALQLSLLLGSTLTWEIIHLPPLAVRALFSITGGGIVWSLIN